MSLQLSHSSPQVIAKSGIYGSSLVLYDPDHAKPDYFLTAEDVCHLIQYFLENTDLEEGDPRFSLIEKIKNFKIVEGWNPDRKRISL